MTGPSLYFLTTDAISVDDRAAWLAGAPAHLDADELARMRRYIFPEKQLEFLMARVLVRGVLATFHDVPARARIEAPDDGNGKPRLADRAGGPFFNISHSHGGIAAIVAPDREVAVDIERLRPRGILRPKFVKELVEVKLREHPGYYGTMVWVSEAAARETGIDAEIIDLRSLWPLDLPTIVNSVKKTRRCVVVHEATRTSGFGAELVALVQEHCFYHLEAPIERVTGWDTPYPHALEWAYFPGPGRVGAALKRAMEE